MYASARDQGLTDEMIAALPSFEDSPLFDDSEKAALKFASVMAGDHQSVSQALFDELKQFYNQSQIMALGWRMAIFVGYGRLVYATGLESVGAPCAVSFDSDASAG